MPGWLTRAGKALATDGRAAGKRCAAGGLFAVCLDRRHCRTNQLPQRQGGAQAVIQIGERLPVGAADFIVEAVEVFVNALQFFDFLYIARK